jgi:hypothetical protein
MRDINEICDQYNITNYIVNPDESIDVNGDVYLLDNELTELPLQFNKVTGYFDCSNNELTTLKGSPKWVGRYFACSNNNLTSLKGCPRWVGGYFICDENQLTSLEFEPDYVGDDFYCEGNYLTDNYCDTEISGDFYTTLKQEGVELNNLNRVINYNEWRKLYKRKKILDDIFNM